MEFIPERAKKLRTIKAMSAAATILFIVISVWWLFIHPLIAEVNVAGKHIWSATYELISLLGGIFGLVISGYWQGRKSIVGRAILVFSIGLFLQSFGQIVYNYYGQYPSCFNNPHTPLGGDDSDDYTNTLID